MTAMSASLRHRQTRRRVVPWAWWQIPVVSTYVDRLRGRAIGDHTCMLISVPIVNET